MPEYIDKVKITTPDGVGKELRFDRRPVVNFITGQDDEAQIQEVYWYGNGTIFDGELRLIHLSSGIHYLFYFADGYGVTETVNDCGVIKFERSDGQGYICFLLRGIVHEMYFTLISLNDANKRRNSPIISASLQLESVSKELDSIEDNKVKYTDNETLNGMIKALYYSGEESDARICIACTGNKEWRVYLVPSNSSNLIGLPDLILSPGLNILNTNTGKLYVVCDYPLAGNVTHNGVLTDNAYDLNQSPAIASYIATEQLIETSIATTLNTSV